MKESQLYRVMTFPKFQFGVPQDYAAFIFAVSLLLGGLGGQYFMGKGLGLLIGAIITFCPLWIIGFFMGRIDPEFFGVWLTNKFKLSDSVGGKRSYEP